MPETKTKPCLLCGAEVRRLHLELGEWKVVACECGVHTLVPGPDEVRMEEFDDGSGYAHYEGLRAAIEAQHRRTLAGLERVVRPGRLLDVGCGTGWFMAIARDRGWETTGVDLSPWSVERTRALGLDAREGLLQDQGFSEGSFDAISLLQVVEHIPDPRDLLAECRRLLRPGGALLVATPNPQSLLARAKGAAWNYWIPPMHCVWYPPKALARLLEQNGFTVERRTTWSARAAGLNDAAELLDRTPLRGLTGKPRGLSVDALALSMDLAGYGTIVEQVAVKP